MDGGNDDPGPSATHHRARGTGPIIRKVERMNIINDGYHDRAQGERPLLPSGGLHACDVLADGTAQCFCGLHHSVGGCFKIAGSG